MSTVELIYDRDCPNVQKARENLLHAFAQAGRPARWVEWQHDDLDIPPHARGYGSPTVLVNGHDIAGAEPVPGTRSCRLYAGVNEGPPVANLVSALRAYPDNSLASPCCGHGWRRRVGWLGSLAALPGIGASLLPVGLCPVCWPAYAGMLGALGLGFLLKTTYLLPVTGLFLLVAVGSLAFRAKSRRGDGPFALGLLASASVMLGKFVFVSDAAMYGGIAVLIAASVWNAWPHRTTETCPACAPGGQASTQPQGAREVSP